MTAAPSLVIGKANPKRGTGSGFGDGHRIRWAPDSLSLVLASGRPASGSGFLRRAPHMILRRCAALLPGGVQEELRRLRFCRRARRGNFSPNEPEADILYRIVSVGDWVLDVGANVGQYTLLLSRLVGGAGRVLAIEPMANTVATLAAVAKLATYRNITILNVAASDRFAVAAFDVPIDDDGLDNYERARIAGRGPIPVLAVPLDALQLPSPIALAKIDAEGHELPVLVGMRRTLERDHPILIVEENEDSPSGFLVGLGYSARRLVRSPNTIYYYGPAHAELIASL